MITMQLNQDLLLYILKGSDVMTIKELDVVLLKNGKEGTVLEVYTQNNDYLIEISNENGETLELPIVNINDIEKVTYHYKKTP